MSSESRNAYLDQVVAAQQQLESDLRSKRPSSTPPPMAAPAAGGSPAKPVVRQEPVGTPDNGTNAVDVRITGFGRWKTVLVPPNAFVVHTRRGQAQPLHLGLGVSFRYNPAIDSFLVVPGAMQTILINAYSICRELQGVMVQAYVQWIIQDFGTAYQKLDFSDLADPMRVVNLQLKEQAEAAIKDKVATMGVHEVLSDKQPIIEELTARLRAVAEGAGGGDQGLGLRIVTVQIKEAVVSSARLWENLQKPYRADQGRLARLAEVAADEAIAEREMAAHRQQESQRMEHDRELGELRAKHEAMVFDRDTLERVRRAEREDADARRLAELGNEAALHALRMERERSEEETEVGRLRLAREHLIQRLTVDGELALARLRVEGQHAEAVLGLERDRMRTEIDNDQSAANLQAKLIDSLPEIMARLPKPTELRAVSIGGRDPTTLTGLLAELVTVVGALRAAVSTSGPAPGSD